MHPPHRVLIAVLVALLVATSCGSDSDNGADDGSLAGTTITVYSGRGEVIAELLA